MLAALPPAITLPYLDVSVFGAEDVEENADPDVLRADVEPCPLARDPCRPNAEFLAHLNQQKMFEALDINESRSV